MGFSSSDSGSECGPEYSSACGPECGPEFRPLDDFTGPDTPEDFLAAWSASRGNLRHFLEDMALPPIDEHAQRAAGEAAVAEAFGLDPTEFDSGITSLSGAFEAAGAPRLSLPDPAVENDRGAAAFFDVDNTLIQGASMLLFGMGLAKRGYFNNLHEILPVVYKQMKFRLTGSENTKAMRQGREQALEFIRGREVAELVALCEEIVDHHIAQKIWPGTKELAELHLRKGQQVWLVSATPVQLAQIIARKCGFTGALGTVAEVKDGRFTGRLVGDILHGPGKRHAIAALAAVGKLDLSRCTAYSDSINDIPMLSMVGTAVAINPDRHLRAHATEHGWEVRDYRSVRTAIRRFGLPALITAAFSTGVWRYIRPGRRMSGARDTDI